MTDPSDDTTTASTNPTESATAVSSSTASTDKISHESTTASNIDESNTSSPAENTASANIGKAKTYEEKIFGGSDSEDEEDGATKRQDSLKDAKMIESEKEEEKEEEEAQADTSSVQESQADDDVNKEEEKEDEGEEDQESDDEDKPLPKFKKAENASFPKVKLRVDKKPANSEESDVELSEKPLDPALAHADKVRKMIDDAVESIKPKKRKRGNVMTEAAMDDILDSLFRRMNDAAEKDIQFNIDKKPAISKLKMLQEALATLNRPGIYEQILENEGLSAIRSWLEPLRDGSLPSIDIQRGLIDLLEKLPVQTDHLRSSGIGKIIYFYQKCGKAIPEIQRRAESLMNYWIRPIIGSSSSYRNRSSYDSRQQEEDQQRRVKKSFRRGSGSGETTPVSTSNVWDNRPAAKEVEDTSRFRASIPLPTMTAFEVVPESRVGAPEKRGKADDNKYKRLSTKLTKLKTRR